MKILVCSTIVFAVWFAFVGVLADGCPTENNCLEVETCCETKTGLWACCPFHNGTCCDDGVHCCPQGNVCSSNGSCLTTNHNQAKDQNQIQCQDGTFCPDGNTCCQLASGQYACCPIENAVCCSDHIHCCPENHLCDTKHGRCTKKSSLPKSVTCPDDSTCPDGDTCCVLQSGDYGCCPLCDAVCCSDHLHCCPHGSTCDLEKGQCLTDVSIPWLEKRPSLRPQHSNLTKIKVLSEATRLTIRSNDNELIVCPDSISFCPRGSNCVSSDGSNWFCCPSADGVFCADGDHCCPSTYRCELRLSKCDHHLFEPIDLIPKRDSIKIVRSSTIDRGSLPSFLTILCPDGISVCPEDATCCQLPDGEYGCCPYPVATCCSDQIHCCPNGYSCDKAGQRCSRRLNNGTQTETIESKFKLKSFIALTRAKDDQLCPDGKTRCSLTTTCCPNGSGQTYSCCPYANGVCCGTNGSVCCPAKYTCDASQLSCQLGESGRERRSLLSSTDDYRQCGLSEVGCANDQTCCRTYGSSDDQYACCAFPNAKCCEDGRHCCPSDSVCDVRSGGCIQVY